MFTFPSAMSAAEVPLPVLETNAAAALTNPVMLKVDSAGTYLSELIKLDRLPGIPTRSVGTISTGKQPRSKLNELRYPFVLTFLVTSKGHAFTNHYTVVQSAHGMPWRLAKAWQTDAQGRIIKEWPVSSVPALHSAGLLKARVAASLTNGANFSLSDTGPARTNLVPTTTTIVGATQSAAFSALTNQVMVEIDAAATYLTKLKRQGRLPGVSKALSRGHVGTGKLPFSLIHHFKYPFSITFYVAPTGAWFTNHYTLLHPAKGAPWQLVKAWRTDTDGRTIKEWQVK